MRRAALILTLSACAHASPPAGARWDYRASLDPAGALSVHVELPPDGDDTLEVSKGHGAHLSRLSVRGLDGGPIPFTQRGDRVYAAGCAAGCALDYRYDLSQGTSGGGYGFDRMFRAARGLVPATPDGWLLRPKTAPPGVRFRLAVTTPPPLRFVSGITPADEPGVYEAAAEHLDDAPYSVFGPLEVRALHARGATLTLAYPRGVFTHGDAPVIAWAERGVRGVAEHLGEFPVPTAAILLLPTPHDGVYFGAARGNGGAAVQIMLGDGVDEAALADDWILIHELTHLGFPNLPPRQSWLEEGLATYLEPVIRARIGLRSERELWAELASKLPGGLADGPLDDAGTWAATYWGGAAFCFLADVLTRADSGGARSLEDALRAIRAQGGTIAARWPTARVLEVADRASGAPVWSELWGTLAERYEPRLSVEEALARLGVRRGPGGAVELDDAAPWAPHRRAIARPFGR